ncbi:hypothetical protein OA50_05164 [Mameliella alba]|uniref:Uncharacterized protein n=2 Tax=Mameliella alba TaxID=561184 RepID=A0A0B3S121_9RHOB|nr:hypothetical protein OA50_05164 [Mameliella alba]
MDMDGRYFADRRQVRRRPKQTERGITMGFVVCEVCDWLNDEAAEEIAEALNMHMDAHPEKH